MKQSRYDWSGDFQLLFKGFNKEYFIYFLAPFDWRTVLLQVVAYFLIITW